VRTRAPVLPLVQRAAPVPGSSFRHSIPIPHSPFKHSALSRRLPKFLRIAQQTKPPIIPPAHSRPQKCNSSPCNNFREPRDSESLNFWRFYPRVFLILGAPKTPAAASRFTAIRRAQMRNDLHAFMFTPFRNSHHCTTFRPVDTRPRSQPLRFFRDLIIFRANPAQMRNKCRPNVSRETSALVPPPPMP
jgi:hypothetical protein